MMKQEKGSLKIIKNVYKFIYICRIMIPTFLKIYLLIRLDDRY
jgi:hypothetical protein